MTTNSKIEWTDHTFNPWEGCQKVGPGCDHCYAETRNARFGGGVAVNWGPGAPRRRTSKANWTMPLHWNARHEAFYAQHGRRQRVFCASLADVFDNAVPPAWRSELFVLIQQTPNLDWLLLTKRIGNVPAMLEAPGMQKEGLPANAWLGATIVNQEEADRDIPKLLALPAAYRFLSMEPLLGPVDLTRIPMRDTCASECCRNWQLDVLNGASYCGDVERDPRDDSDEAEGRINWVIVGGESGPRARPMHPDWARTLRDQCNAAGVPFFFKQWGEWLPSMQDGDLFRSVNEINASDHPVRVGKKAAGRVLDGRTWNEVPR